MWAKIAEGEDVISYKKLSSQHTITIEARQDKELWQIYKTYQMKGVNKLVQRYTAKNRQEAQALIEDLKIEKELSEEEIQEAFKAQNKSVNLELQREYKEYEVEKWVFVINQSAVQNFVIIRFSDDVVIDIVLHEHYKLDETRILGKLFKTLNIKDMGTSIKQNIYYFNDEYHHTEGEKFLLGQMDFDQ